MCHVFASTHGELFEPITRSVRIGGVVTSLRLEAAFWRIIDEIARASEMSTGRFLSTLFDEVVEIRGEVGNFASLLRVIACRWVSGEVGGMARPGLLEPLADRARSRPRDEPHLSTLRAADPEMLGTPGCSVFAVVVGAALRTRQTASPAPARR